MKIRRITSPFVFAIGLTVLASCSALKNTESSRASQSEASVERAVVLDFGSLDTLDKLNLADHVVALPKQSLPAYLSHYSAEKYEDVGGMKSPDLDAIRDARPSVIVATGRQSAIHDHLEDIAPVLDMSLEAEGYLAGVDAKVRRLAQHFGATAKAELELDVLHTQVEQAREQIARDTKVLVVTHNDGHLVLNRHPVVHEVLNIPLVALPKGVQSETRGTRTFTPLSVQQIRQINPDVVLVIDRSAAIGSGESLNAPSLKQALNQQTSDVQVTVLSPALWYLSGGGIQSLKLQIHEVLGAL